MQDLSVENRDSLLAEYNNIHQSCENRGNAQNTLFIFALTAIGAILSFSLQQHNPYIALVGFAVLIAVRCRVMWFRDSIFNDWAYLRIVIEPKLQLNSGLKRSVKETHFLSNIHYWIYTMLGLGIVFTYLANNPHDIIWFISMIIMLVLVVVLDIYYFFGSRWVYKYYEQHWIKIKNESQ